MDASAKAVSTASSAKDSTPDAEGARKPRIMVHIVAYNAVTTLGKVLIGSHVICVRV